MPTLESKETVAFTSLTRHSNKTLFSVVGVRGVFGDLVQGTIGSCVQNIQGQGPRRPASRYAFQITPVRTHRVEGQRMERHGWNESLLQEEDQSMFSGKQGYLVDSLVFEFLAHTFVMNGRNIEREHKNVCLV